jgi:hypothetical protein
MILYKQYVQGFDGMLHFIRGANHFASKSERYSWATEWRGQGGSAYAYESAMLAKGIGVPRGKKSTPCKRGKNKKTNKKGK